MSRHHGHRPALAAVRAARRLGADRRGVAAIEAALFMPLAAAFFGLLAFGGQALSLQRKVTLTAHTVTDLVSQQSSPVAKSALDCLLGVSASVLSPYDLSRMTIVVSEVQVDSSGQTGTVMWSEALQSHGTALAQNASVTLPGPLSAAGSYLIYGQVQYTYQPFQLWFTPSTLTLHDEIYLSPRLLKSIAENPNG